MYAAFFLSMRVVRSTGGVRAMLGIDPVFVLAIFAKWEFCNELFGEVCKDHNSDTIKFTEINFQNFY